MSFFASSPLFASGSPFAHPVAYRKSPPTSFGKSLLEPAPDFRRSVRNPLENRSSGSRLAPRDVLELPLSHPLVLPFFQASPPLFASLSPFARPVAYRKSLAANFRDIPPKSAPSCRRRALSEALRGPPLDLHPWRLESHCRPPSCLGAPSAVSLYPAKPSKARGGARATGAPKVGSDLEQGSVF